MKNICFYYLLKKKNKVYPSPRLDKKYLNNISDEFKLDNVSLEKIVNPNTMKTSSYQKVIPENIPRYKENNPYKTQGPLGVHCN